MRKNKISHLRKRPLAKKKERWLVASTTKKGIRYRNRQQKQ